MNSIHSEFLKLKRSMSWAVVLVVPISGRGVAELGG